MVYVRMQMKYTSSCSCVIISHWPFMAHSTTTRVYKLLGPRACAIESDIFLFSVFAFTLLLESHVER